MRNAAQQGAAAAGACAAADRQAVSRAGRTDAFDIPTMRFVPAPITMTAHVRVFPLVLALLVVAAPAHSQPRPWMDSTLRTPEAEIYRTWLRYVASKPAGITDCYTRSSYWLASEQTGGCYDLANSFLMPGTRPRVVRIEPVGSRRSEYRLVLEARHSDPSATAPTWWTSMQITVYAVRDSGRWVLSGALSRTTATWKRVVVGPITYVIQPGHGFDPVRARRAVAWSDSIADAFGVRRLPPLRYFLTLSSDDVYRIMGLESAVKYGPGGGNAQRGMIFSGTPSVGEDYRHELMHALMAPLTSPATTYLASEGVATWVGGTAGFDFRGSVAGLARHLAEHPAVTLDSILERGLKSFTATEIYPAGAVLADMVFERGGVPAVKAFLGGGPTTADLRVTLARLLGQPWPRIAASWRARVAAIGARPAG
jgi:hypothetical protein